MKKEKLTIDKVAELCKTDLNFLCTQILGYTDWDVCHDDLEAQLGRPSKRKLIMYPRGHLKTSFVTKAYAIQYILKNPNARVLIANQVWDRSREMLYEVKELLTGKSDLNKIFGNFQSGRWREDEIVISQRKQALAAPSIGTTGVEAEMTSAHFDLIILDDLQGMQNSQTKEQRDKVKRFYRYTAALLDPGGELILLGTRYHFDDYYSHILENERKYFDIQIRRVIEDGKVIFPKKFNLKFDEAKKDWIFTKEPTQDYINFLKKTMGQDFYSQYMNEPVDGENQLIKQEYFRYYERVPENLFKVLTVDPAISVRANSDFTGMVVCGMNEKRDIYVLDTVKQKWASPAEIIDKIFDMVDKWHPDAVGLETIGFQKTLKWGLEEEMRRRKQFFGIADLKASPKMKKEYRLKALEPYYRNRVILHQKWMTDLEQELMNIATDGFKGAHDDLADALAYQLDILVPGSDYKRFRVPVGSWQYEADEARKALSPYDFFKE